MKQFKKQNSVQISADENISRKVMNDLTEFLSQYYFDERFEWEPDIYEKEAYSFAGKDVNGVNDNEFARIIPDGGVIWWIKNGKRIPIITCEDKSSYAKNGSAYARFCKNLYFFKSCFYGNETIFPYVIFHHGPTMVSEDGTIAKDTVSWARQGLSELNGKVFNPNQPKSLLIENWNLMFFQREPYTYEQKYKVLESCVLKTMQYFLDKLK